MSTSSDALNQGASSYPTDRELQLAQRIGQAQEQANKYKLALLEIRDGLRSDGRVWLRLPGQPDEMREVLVSREQGPSLEKYINEVLA